MINNDGQAPGDGLLHLLAYSASFGRLLIALMKMSSPGIFPSSPRSIATRCAQKVPDKATAFTPL